MFHTLKIEKIETIQCERLASLHQKCFEKGWSKKNFEDYLRSPLHQFWGAFDADQLRGFILFQVIESEAEILTFGVDPEFQSQGVGRQILTLSIEELKKNNLEFVFLDVAHNNQHAILLYLSCGFKKMMLRKQYYARKSGINQDAIVMKLKIK
ncbi:protein N-acetyltransferase RimI [Candidatus Bealeia paramacronuclearis]|uniref:[Ribosomal protein bS18]-alanine N-acetyltransferase n=1 Tax=Candidatus Bealeia paramacronuclearis TaxID=1921001 RepID=A0ABZ2C285_9PROT|nr:protein N-acetyltransferase RimI [Candidatus Bealeia paramacronuclearis]